MARKSRRSTNQSLFAFANLLNVFAQQAAGYIGAQERARLDALKAENLRLRSILTELKQGQESNKILEGDLKIELLKLKIKREEWTQRNMGIDAPTFTAENYAESGDVRHGKLPPES